MSKAIATSNKNLDDNMILGHLFFYTLGELKIEASELESLFVKHGLSKNYIRRISPVDAFRRATSDMKQTAYIYYHGSQIKAKIEVDEVASNENEVVRVIGRKVPDQTVEDLSYEVIGKIFFDRKNESVSYSYAQSRYGHEFNYEVIFDEALNKFGEWTTYHTKDTVRNVTTAVLKSMYPVNLMPSGMAKFIPNRSKEELYALQSVIRELSDYGEECLFELVPVVDTDEMRKTLDKSAENEIRTEAISFIQEMKDAINKKSDLSARSAASYIQKSQELEQKIREYEKLLGTYMGFARTQVAEIYRIATESQQAVI